MKKFLILFLIIFFNADFYSEIPSVPDDYIILEMANSGYDLYIKKMEGIESILLTESEKDPSLKKTNYGLRTPKFYPCNGNEIRILNGKILHTKYDLYSLIDSTIEPHPILKEAFHFFLTDTLLYGYKWTRQGEIEVKPGTRINLRLFEKKYGDYSGNFKDQWIILKLFYNKTDYNRGVIEEFKDISNAKAMVITKSEDFKKQIHDLIVNTLPIEYDLDLIFIIDCTLSMKEEMPVFKNIFPELKNDILKKIKKARIAFIFYRDYGDMFLNKIYDFTDDLTYVDYLVKNIQIDGGADIPEAIYEAIYEIKKLNFKSDNRAAFLIGDAPAHPVPRGKVSKDDAKKILEEFNVKFNTICIPVK
ncbi:MAG: VWA domain-containing protein [Spirochaetes bacterium]|nr:VWA domain-containing protein [Spirochaetota bacterium]